MDREQHSDIPLSRVTEQTQMNFTGRTSPSTAFNEFARR
jgi:hypothetical protein